MASLPTILLILAALSMGATVIATLVAFRSQKEASSAIFPIVREEESKRAQRARLSIFAWLAVTALFFGGWLATLRLVQPGPTVETDSGPAAPTPQPPVEAANAPAATHTPAPIVKPSPTAPPSTPVPANTPTPTQPPAATPLPTNTSTPKPTATPVPPTNTPVPPTATAVDTATPAPPAATPTVAQLLSAATRTPAPPEVRVGPIKFTTEVSDDLKAVDSRTVFQDGASKIYAVFPFQGMTQGLEYTVIWYKNGLEIARDEGLWEWGKQGDFFTFVGPQGKGLYKLELYIHDTIVATKIFEVVK